MTDDHGVPAHDQRRPPLAQRVHVDLPRIRPEDMVGTQDVTPARDPRGGTDTDTAFMLRHAGW